jgi:hypothetical protein
MSAANGVSRVRAAKGHCLTLDDRALTKRIGLTLPTDLGLEDWKRIGRQIFAITDASAWWLGDWLVYGQNRYPERYQRAVEETGLDYQTLRNYAWVARKFEPSARHEGLSIQHHVEVAALPPAEREEWLSRAHRLGWSRNRLRQHLRASRAAGSAAEHPAPEETSLHLSIDPAKVERWRQAAEVAGSDFDDWAARVLDEAAGREQPPA